MAIAAGCMIIVELSFAIYSYLTSRVLHGTGAVSPLAFAWLRDVVGTSLLLGATVLGEFRKPPSARVFWPHEADRLRVALCGLLGVWGSQGMSALALANLDPFFFSVMQPLMPLVTLVLGIAVGIEQPLRCASLPAWGKVVGLGIAIGGATGIIVIQSSSNSGSSSSSAASTGSPALGGFFLAIQIILGGSYNVVQRPLTGRYSSLAVAAWGYASGLVFLTLSVITGASKPSDWELSRESIIAIAFSGIFASGLAYFLMAIANSLGGPLIVVCFYPLLPFAVGVIEFIFDGTKTSVAEIGAGLCIMLGVITVVTSKVYETEAEALSPKLLTEEGEANEDEGVLMTRE